MRPALAALVMVGMSSYTGVAGAERLPVEDFCKGATLGQIRLSPDGLHMAAISHDHGQTYVVVSDLGTGRKNRISGGHVRSFTWLTDQRLLCYAGGSEAGAIFAINIDGTQEVTLNRPYFSQASESGGYRCRGMQVLKVLPAGSDSLLVEDYYFTRWNYRSIPRREVKRINFFTGKATLVEKNPGDVFKWLSDKDGNIRGAVAIEKDTVQLLYRPRSQDRWNVVYKSGRENLDLHPYGFSPDEKEIYVATHNGGDAVGLYEFDIETKQIGKQLFSDSQYDLAAPLFQANGAPLGVLYAGERHKFKALDPAFEKVQADVEAALPDGVNIPVSFSRDGSKIIYLSANDRDPGSYYLVDHAKGTFGIVGRSALWIKPEAMAAVQPIQYAARDDQTIHGYLTLPPGSTGTNLPLIVMPHGGPNARDSWEYDPQVQFLANRGYAVLQMNFRGSTGYGLKFMRAGFKEWGGKMQDDITDGVNWAISHGIADKSRIGVFGSSYGGYAALMGLIKTPQLFKCAISYCGVIDVDAFAHYVAGLEPFNHDFERIAQERIGDYRADKKHLEEISPGNLQDKIQAPILLTYGARDPKVDVEQARKLANGLTQKNKKFELIIEEKEGHGFYRLSARTNLYNRIERFLNENLGGSEQR